jgi:putative glutathione S-transferase
MGGLGPADAQGRYQRPASPFTTLPPLPQDAGEPGAHVLIVGRSCPWAHRTALVHCLRQLAGTIELLVVDPDPQAGRWRFSEPFEGSGTLAELYRRSGAARGTRATVPVLWSRSQGKVVVGESARLIELLDLWPSPKPLRLQPPERLEAITRWRERLQDAVNDGVYRCGFARNQAAYDEAEEAFWQTLAAIEQTLQDQRGQGLSQEAELQRQQNPRQNPLQPSPEPLESGEPQPDQARSPGDGNRHPESDGPWLAGGPTPTLADVQLFPTLVRLELVYGPLFGVSRRPLWQLPALWDWRRRFFALPGVADTCFADAWRRDYFGALFPLHPSGIIPAGPDLASLLSAMPPSTSALATSALAKTPQP